MLKKIKKYKYLITIILIIVLVVLVIIKKKELKGNASVNSEDSLSLFKEELIKTSEKETEEDTKTLKVDIKGQVVNPGVYELPIGTRVIDLINTAGGLTTDANTSLINLSKILTDEMVVIIYSNYEVANSNVKQIETVYKIIEKDCNCPSIKNDGCINTEEETDEYNGLININTASLEQLTTLPGIGESKAKSIIEYRENTPFTTIEDIMNVSGIGESAYSKIKDYITV